jgi:hypothetical protein
MKLTEGESTLSREDSTDSTKFMPSPSQPHSVFQVRSEKDRLRGGSGACLLDLLRFGGRILSLGGKPIERE